MRYVHGSAPFAPLLLSRVLSRNSPRKTNALPHTSYTQDEKLPLHHAIAKGAPPEVMKLLLDANLEAVNARDKVRR